MLGEGRRRGRSTTSGFAFGASAQAFERAVGLMVVAPKSGLPFQAIEWRRRAGRGRPDSAVIAIPPSFNRLEKRARRAIAPMTSLAKQPSCASQGATIQAGALSASAAGRGFVSGFHCRRASSPARRWRWVWLWPSATCPGRRRRPTGTRRRSCARSTASLRPPDPHRDGLGTIRSRALRRSQEVPPLFGGTEKRR